MAGRVLQTKQKRERIGSDGLPGSSSSDGRKEKQSSNTCQALDGIDWGYWTRGGAGQEATTVQAVVAVGGFWRQTVNQACPTGRQVLDDVSQKTSSEDERGR